jgi:hypothetical protein
MSNITLPTTLQSVLLDTYTRTKSGSSVDVQTVVHGNPFTQTTGTLASATSLTVTGLDDAASIVFAVYGTYAATFVFEVSEDGTNWFAITGVRFDSATGETTSGALTSTSRAWRANIAGFSQFRVRCSAYTSGTANWIISPTPYAFDITPFAGISSLPALIASSALAGDFSNAVRTIATNAASRFRLVSAASTNATSVKAAAGRVYGWQFSNTTAAYKFVKLYNVATAPTVGTTAITDTIAIPPNDSITWSTPIGVHYATGIALAVTGAAGDADATAVAANDVIGQLFYA